MDIEVAKIFASAIAVSFGAICPAIGEGLIAAKALETMGRNPEVANKVATNMIIGMALIESLAIYCLLIAFMILFAI